MFSLHNQAAKLMSVNPRAEINGTDHVMAADLKLEIKVSNDLLSEFDPSLKSRSTRRTTSTMANCLHPPGTFRR